MFRTLCLTNRIIATTSSTCGIIPLRMSTSTWSPTHKTSQYEEAVGLLNSLQSNAATIKKAREQRDSMMLLSIPYVRQHLKSLGVSVEELDQLNIIHVSGTKGKGSTCAYVEKILRDSGLRTGLFTSPHLIHVRERIRINGEPVEEELFATELIKAYNILKSQHSDNMPPYFKFLTLLAFQIFKKSNLDVVILEVGIGGEYDCTNVVEHPKVVGITTLDYDHVSLLGSTLSKIAWHKAGIMKENVPVFYSPTTDEALTVIKNRAIEKKCSIIQAPEFASYRWPRSVSTGIAGRHQEINVSLALQLAYSWSSQNSYSLPGIELWKPGKTFDVPSSICNSIESCKWPGRSEVLKTNKGITYLLDGAHTPKSMEACAEWANEEFKLHKGRRILLFQCTADRCPSSLIPYLTDLGISQIISCPTQIYSSLNKSSDSSNFNTSIDEQMKKAWENVESWRNNMENAENLKNDQSRVFDCISEAVEFIEKQAENEELCVLVTGSLHLVGGVLNLVEKQRKL